MNVPPYRAVRPLCDVGVCKVKCGWVRGLDEVDERDEEIKLSDDEDVQSGTRPVTKMLDPKLPSHEEVLAHQLNHIPYANLIHEPKPTPAGPQHSRHGGDVK